MTHLLHQLLITASVPQRIALFRLVQSRTGWTPNQIQSFQEKRLREIIGYCWQYIPFYRDHWRGAISDPGEIQTIEDLQKLPILTKDHVREHLSTLVTTDPSVKSAEARTGGSTGRPIIFRMTYRDEQLAWAHKYKGWSWAA
jgi:phenylacetate-CoA ligase